MSVLSLSAALLDWLLLRQCAVLPGRRQRQCDRPPAGRRPHVHEQAEEGRRQSVRLLSHQGEILLWLDRKTPKAFYKPVKIQQTADPCFSSGNSANCLVVLE